MKMSFRVAEGRGIRFLGLSKSRFLALRPEGSPLGGLGMTDSRISEKVHKFFGA